MNIAVIKKTLVKDGCPIHYWVTGPTDKPWVILLHGAGADHRMFDTQTPILNTGFRVLSWDTRGHGLSRPLGDQFSIRLLVGDLLAIMERENIGRAVLVGQSMGGNTAQEMAFLYPERVDSLVLVDCTCNTMKLSRWEKLLLQTGSSLINLFPWKYLVEKSARASSVNPGVQEYIRKSFFKIGKPDFTRIFSETARCLHHEPDYTINKDILLVHGDEDNLGNIKRAAQYLASREPRCQYFTIKNAGHCSNQDNPQEFNQLLLEFLSKTRPNTDSI